MKHIIFNITIGLILSAVCIVYLLHNVELSLLGNHLSKVGFEYVVIFFIATFGIHVIRLVRWGLLLRPLGPISWRKVIAICSVGQLAIYLFPARLGELVRPVLVSEESSITFGEASSTVAVERIIDGLIMTALLFVTVFLMRGQAPDWFIQSGVAAGCVFGGILFTILVAARFKSQTTGLLHRTIGRLSRQLVDRIVAVIEQFFKGLSHLKGQRKTFVKYLIASVSMWLLYAFSFVILFRAFGFELGFVAGMAMNSLLIVGIMIPAAPGFTGTFHSAVILALGLFSIEGEIAVDFAFLVHIETVLVNLLLGTLGLLLGRIRFARIFRLNKSTPNAINPPQNPALVNPNDRLA